MIRIELTRHNRALHVIERVYSQHIDFVLTRQAQDLTSFEMIKNDQKQKKK